MDAEKVGTNSQRAANYWSSQDDACRSPVLSHIPSTSSKLGAAKGSDHHVPGFVPDDRTSSNAEPQSERRWWLSLEPTVRHLHKGSNTDSNSNPLGAECGVYGAVLVNKNVTITGEKRFDEKGDIQKYLKGNGGNLVDSPNKAFVDFMKNDQDVKIEEPNVVSEDDKCRVPYREIAESWCVDEDWKDLDPYKCSVHEKSEKLCSELESQWIEVEKNEPWWRTADKDDLTSFVSCKKLDQFENCDLPQPQSNHQSGPSECTQSFNEATILASLCKKVDKETDLYEQKSEIPNSVSMFESQHIVGVVQCFPSSSNRVISRSDSFATEEEESEELQRLDSDLTKTQLLEALCHSQTRAREAEKAARQAYDEKEHIVKHFFTQASHLFAYRQWLQMLQIETLCLQHKNTTDECLQQKNNIEGLQPKIDNDESISAEFPGLLAVSREGRKVGKVRRKATKRAGIPSYQLRRSLIGFAVGLSLAGAGLLLGWTLGRENILSASSIFITYTKAFIKRGCGGDVLQMMVFNFDVLREIPSQAMFAQLGAQAVLVFLCVWKCL
ncbi:hypothetical protein POM88_011258 [Heracleum sosnowskyi]|uniref:Uncharacterized protein n=1 Tax=Heracleum sosnowskyi TaxID=360622 RepID=A0AAD8IXL1_9APIA|nr:hypothetical protein POM88_011258 [Heracleum sosnowskyi]